MARAKGPGAARMTMQDLAALAGVSSITVSRALRGSTLVREEVREQIKALAAKHGYRLNAAARNLRTMRAHSITAVVEMDPTTERPMSEPLVLSVIGGLLQTLTMQGYRLVLTTRAEALSSNVIDADGIILLGQGPNNEATGQIRRFDLPMVVWGASQPATDKMVFVGSDNRAAAAGWSANTWPPSNAPTHPVPRRYRPLGGRRTTGRTVSGRRRWRHQYLPGPM